MRRVTSILQGRSPLRQSRDTPLTMVDPEDALLADTGDIQSYQVMPSPR